MGNMTKRDAVYKALKKAINSGYLMPGTRLIEVDLAGQYGVSRTIIREVMKQLAAEGIIELIPYKGGAVAKASATDLEEIYRIQQDLEGLAAYLAAKRLTKKQIAELEHIHEASKQQGRDDVNGWQKWNTRFHRTLIDNCGNRRLMRLVKNHEDQFARYWFLLLSIPGRIEESIREHEQILGALKRQKPEEVRALMERHFEGASGKLLEIIRNVYPSSFTH